jgi:hypothetical protein
VDIIKYIALATALFILTSCALTPKEEQYVNATYRVDKPILISIIDKRTRVKHIEKSARKDRNTFEEYAEAKHIPKVRYPNFVGVARSYGIPTDWTIDTVAKEDKYLAEFLQERIVNGLKRDGWKVTPVKMSTVSTDEAHKLMINNHADKMIVLIIYEWYFDINLNWVTAFQFRTNTDTYAFDAVEGNILVENIKETDIVDERYDESLGNLILDAYKAQLDQILNSTELKSKLVH